MDRVRVVVRGLRGRSDGSGSWVGEHVGENSGDEKAGSEETEEGDVGPVAWGGGVVDDDGRGDDRLEESGDWAGDEGRGELMSVGGNTGDLWNPLLRLGADESSTSFRSDCRKLGPAALASALGRLLVVDAAAPPALDDSARSDRSGSASVRLVRGLFNFRSG